MSRTILATILMAVLLSATPALARDQSLAGIIAEGLTAAAQKDVEGLTQAANRLDRLGAHPAEGTDDLVVIWRAEAVKLGARVNTTPYRGRTLGPAYRHYEIASGDRLATRQSFNAGQKAEISLVSLSSARLELKVRDEDGAVVCGLIIANRNGACAWTPGWTASYAIDVTNLTNQAAPVYIITN